MKTRIALNGNDGNWRIGVGETARFECTATVDWDALETFLENHNKRTRFVLISYELRDAIYPKKRAGNHRFPLISIWVPESVYLVEKNNLRFSEGLNDSANEALALACLNENQPAFEPITWHPRQSKDDYLQQLRFLKEQIQLGNLYEINYCQEFYAENVRIDAVLPVYHALNKVTKAPYSVLYESEKWMIAGASPERFIAKTGNRLSSQPIKGTAPRGKTLPEDQRLKDQLASSLKDRTENVMIVDLVRNDLARIAAKNSVQVDELFGVYSFPTVHQLISTVSCELRDEVTFSGILKATFPMGSMTGAPKVAAMDLAEQTERFTRGIYSGSAGYMTPNGDFDFNVMIRTLVADREQQSVSCGVGGAITIFSDPEEEYEECRAKVGKILEATGTCQW
ncbi:MAG TPA: anthranilate synthase component I family protein [Fluviicola sp.]|nr:anthranilate synthase component I family protein [Fluviicola sp.]